MDKTHEEFKDNMNNFMDLFKTTRTQHTEHLMTFSKELMKLHDEIKLMKEEIKTLESDEKNYGELKQKCEFFERENKKFNLIFQEFVKSTNIQLGAFSNLWGGYIENISVLYILNYLKKNFEVHTWYQKYKTHWDKNKSVEIDLMALNDNRYFIVEVKNTLSEESKKQIEKTIENTKLHLFEYENYPIQPIALCLNIKDDSVLDLFKSSNIWVCKYEENYENGDKWNWLVGGNLSG